MKRVMVWLGLGLGACLLAGCEWTAGGGVDTWNSNVEVATNYAGIYRASDGGILVRSADTTSNTTVIATNVVTTTNTVSSELLGTGTGQATAFSGVLQHTPVGGSLTIAAGSYKFTDSAGSSSGTIDFNVDPADGSSGTLNYDTATWTLNFPAPLASGTLIQATYSYLSVNTNVSSTTTTSSGAVIQGNHGDPIYSFTVFQTGNTLQLLDNNANEYEGIITSGEPASTATTQFSVTGNSGGYAVTMVGLFQMLTTYILIGDEWVPGEYLVMDGSYIEEGGYNASFFGVAYGIITTSSSSSTNSAN